MRAVIAAIVLSLLFVLVIIVARAREDTGDPAWTSVVMAESMRSDELERLSVSFVADYRHYPDSISLIAVVSDEYGNVVAGLAPPFSKEKLFEKIWDGIVELDSLGERHNVKRYTVREHRAAAAAPSAAAMVLDYSGSMVGHIEAMEQGVRRALASIDAGTPLALLKFDHRVRAERPLAPSAPGIDTLLTGIAEYGGSTALYDAAAAGLAELKGADATRKSLIIFSDGEDNASLFTYPSDVVEQALADSVVVHTIAFGPADNYALEYLSAKTGGQKLTASSHDDLASLFRRILLLDRVHYRITYTPPLFPGQHDIELTRHVDDTVDMPIAFARYNRAWRVAHLDRPMPKVLALFPFGTCAPPIVDSAVVERLARHLKANPTVIASLQGHSDTKGEAGVNWELSLQRAGEFRLHLLTLGVPLRQIWVRGFGESRPIHKDDWPSAERALENRRVEVELITG